MSSENNLKDSLRNNIYEYLKDKDGLVSKRHFLELLKTKGVLIDDLRIASFIKSTLNHDDTLKKEYFISCLTNPSVTANALSHSYIIPDFEKFTHEVTSLYKSCSLKTGGKVNEKIPFLPSHNGDHFGVSICTINGQRFNIGETKVDFSIQSCCKPINYCLAAHEHGIDVVHRHIGREPSGIKADELVLDSNGLPHNPLINSGGIMACSFIKSDLTPVKRFEYILSMWKKLSGGKPLGFSKKIYQKERTSGYRNFAMAYIMEEGKIFPEKTNLVDVLENYFKCHSLTIKADTLSIVAATLAHGGVCPLTGEQVFSTEVVKNCLSLMYSCGMDDYSGEFAFKIGLPASSSGTGGLFIVIPNVMGICVYSPKLDDYGNSVRGVEFFERLTELHNFHMFEMTSIDKTDPTVEMSVGDVNNAKIITYSSIGDLSELRRLKASRGELTTGDYDKRTPLHLAASNGHLEVLKYILKEIGMVNVNPIDRWGGTPLDDSIREDHYEVSQYLKSVGGITGHELKGST